MLNKALSLCLSSIAHQTLLMKQCLAEGGLLQALKHSLNFLNELRTNQLPPKQYYEVYIAVFDALEVLTGHLLALHKLKLKKPTPFLADLYELVQYSGNIIPRLYLMIAVGTTYMATKDAPAKEIMKDMIEMCRGVQHPIRGLFLRYYLLQRTKDLLPLGSKDDFQDTTGFLVSNFIEMNKLWVRLQHQGHSSERELRYRERKELKILVGLNLVRLSQVIDDYSGDDGYCSEKYYKESIFPIITEQIIQCRDHLAQSYLIDVVIQIFPDSFHFATLDSLLDVFFHLHPLLRRSELVATLVDRFITYRRYEDDLRRTERLNLTENEPLVQGPPLQLFATFWAFYLKLFEQEPELPADEHSHLLQDFIRLLLTYDADNYANLDQVYQFATEKLPSSAESSELWLQLLVAPIQHFSSIKSLLKLSFFHEFYLKLAGKDHQKQISLEIVNKLLGAENREFYADLDEIDGVFKYLLVLIKDSDTQDSTYKNLGLTATIKVGEKVLSAEFLQNQEKLCKILHLLEHPDPFKSLSNLMYVRKKYLNKNPENIVYTYPTLILKILHKLRIAGYVNLKRKYTADSQEDLLITSNFKNLSVIIDELYQHHQQLNSELILKLYLETAGVADQLQRESIAYELYTQCFIIYEEHLTLSASSGFQNPHEAMGGSLPYQSIVLIANKLATLRFFTRENYEGLITKLTLYGSKLLKKQDQCRAVYYCAHLWWWCDLLTTGASPTVEGDNEGEKKEEEEGESDSEKETLYRDPKRVLECLQKGLRIADSCMDPYLSLKLFVEILNRCLIFHVYGNHLVDSRYINGLIDLIKTNLDNLRDDNGRDDEDQESKLLKQIELLFDRSLTYIADQQVSEDQFHGIVV